MPNRLRRFIRASRPTLPFTEMMSIGGSADVNTSIFVMEASYRNVSCSGKAATAVINSGRAVIADPTPKSLNLRSVETASSLCTEN
jgi:hypothetical protein